MSPCRRVSWAGNLLDQWSRRLGAGNKGAVTLYNLGVDYDFIPSFGLDIKQAEIFPKNSRQTKKEYCSMKRQPGCLGLKISIRP